MQQVLVYRKGGPCRSLASSKFQDPTIHKIEISGSVGAGGVNKAPDVRRIQEALNRVPERRGGPAVPLKVDGLFGDNTYKAIVKYQKKQLGMADGRIDPGKLTIRHLSYDEQMHPLEGEDAVRFAVSLIPRVQAALLAAQGALLIAERERDASGLMGQYGRPQVDALDRIFQIRQFPDPLSQIRWLQSLVREMSATLARGYAAEDAPFTGVFAPNTLIVEDYEAWAYTTGGGCRLLGQTITYLPPLGATVRADKIFITQQFGDQTISEQIFALIHELAHFCGPPRENPNTVDDYGYGALDAGPMTRLLPWQRIHNADHIGHYIWEAAFRTPSPRG